MSAVLLPIRLVSAANVREHWAVRARRVQRERGVARLVMSTQPRPNLPCTVTLTRIAPRPLDGHDNLRAACKACVDGIADWLGIDDGDPRVTWSYGQERGGVRQYGVCVSIAWGDQ